VAYSLGYADGQRISRGEMLEVAGRIARAADIPVTADLEAAGYGTTAKDMAGHVKSAIAEGIIGMNLEDVTGDDESSLVDLPLQVEKIPRHPRSRVLGRRSFCAERAHGQFI